MANATLVDRFAPPPPSVMRRSCLRCSTEFKARGKFNRLCRKCRDAARAIMAGQTDNHIHAGVV